MTRAPGLFRTLQSLLRIFLGRPRIPASLKENDLLQTVLKRRSVRSFTSRPISEDVFSAILEAGRLAPSTVNLQSWTFAVFDSALWQQMFERPIPFHGSRAVIVIADSSRHRQVLAQFPSCPLMEYTIAVMNASLAAMNMNIAAEALGVSSVMLSETGRSGILDARFLKEKLALPDGAFPLMTIVFGYAGGTYPPMPPKLPLEQILLKGRYRPVDQDVLDSWLDQMVAGYNVTHLGSSFNAQLSTYQRKIDQAENDLHEMIFYQQKRD